MPPIVETTPDETDPAPWYNNALRRAGLPTLSHKDLDEMLSPFCSTPAMLKEAKKMWIKNAELTVPTGEIPVLGRKPHEDGQPNLKLLRIPGDPLAIRFFRGGFTAGRRMLFFDFVDPDMQPVNKPRSYTLSQFYADSFVELKALHEVFRTTATPEGECFAILEDVCCVLRRPGHADWQFTTAVNN